MLTLSAPRLTAQAAATVTAASGQTVRRDFALELLRFARPGVPAEDTVLTLEQFVVAAARETNAAALGAFGWNYQRERLRFDVSAEYQLTKHFGLYATGRNIFNNRDQTEFYADGSPRYVKFASEGKYGVTIQFGVKGSF